MEKIPRGAQVDQITEQARRCFDPEGPVAFFPIRHHSPVCAWHLTRWLDTYRPDAVLVEGPADTNALIPAIVDPACQAPVCVYYAHVDGEGRRTACYFPLLDFSPEWVALRWAAANGRSAEFIDLPYGRLATAEKTTGDTDESGKKPGYYVDYHEAQSRYLHALCRREHCRDRGELWEKLFEIGGLRRDTPTFVHGVLAFCHYTRLDYPPALLHEEGTLDREAYMAACIARARAAHGRVLVVCGGFHASALADRLRGDPPPPPVASPSDETAEAYLIPFSFEESDQLSGYASGMPHPAFYQRVHTHLREGDAARAYERAVIHFLIRTGAVLRARGVNVSVSEEGAALAQCRGLARLRGKAQPGVYELLDGVTNAYVKGEMGWVDSPLLVRCRALLRGNKRGKTGPTAGSVPLLKDFRDVLARFKLKTARTTGQDIILDVLANPRHRGISVFFHRLCFLDVHFAEWRAGPDYRGRDTRRVRELWRYAVNAKVESELVDAARLGGSVMEAAAEQLNRQARPDADELPRCGDLAARLVDALVMDLPDFIAPLYAALEDALAEDGDFASLADAAATLRYLDQVQWLLSGRLPDRHVRVLSLLYTKSASLLPYVDAADENTDRALAGQAGVFYALAQTPGLDPSLATEALAALVERSDIPPFLHGASMGLLYGADRITPADALASLHRYLSGTTERTRRSGLFLGGLFHTAWDVVFRGEVLIEGIGRLLADLSEDDFLFVLPDLRLAFSRFAPRHLHRIARMAAAPHGVEPGRLLAAGVPEPVRRRGVALDGHMRGALRARGLL